MFFPRTCSLYGLPQLRKKKHHRIIVSVFRSKTLCQYLLLFWPQTPHSIYQGILLANPSKYPEFDHFSSPPLLVLLLFKPLPFLLWILAINPYLVSSLLPSLPASLPLYRLFSTQQPERLWELNHQRYSSMQWPRVVPKVLYLSGPNSVSYQLPCLFCTSHPGLLPISHTTSSAIVTFPFRSHHSSSLYLCQTFAQMSPFNEVFLTILFEMANPIHCLPPHTHTHNLSFLF